MVLPVAGFFIDIVLGLPWIPKPGVPEELLLLPAPPPPPRPLFAFTLLATSTSSTRGRQTPLVEDESRA